MKHFMLFALVIIAAVCFVSGAPAPQEAAATPENTIQEAFNKAAQEIADSFNNMKPQLEKLMQQGQEMIRDAAEKIQQGATKIIPKTE